MKQFFLLVFTTIMLHEANACKCRELSFSEELQHADQVFIGRVLDKTVNVHVQYRFLIVRRFKGTMNDTTTITTGLGGGDCGAAFETGLNYLIFANDGATNRCRRNGVDKNNKDVSRLAFLYDSVFSSGIGKDAGPLLTDQEAAYFDVELLTDRQAFDFRNKKIAFVYNNIFSNKQEYFKNFGGKEVAHTLLLLSDKEKKLSNGYDAIITYSKKVPVSKKLRKKWIKELGEKG